ncbi:MAG TPA: DNA repair protein RecO [Methylibium sp.]|nr:DNA repair protein RecO [Methylibium sp.]
MNRRVAPALQPAYLLHAHDWSESSAILDLFTREQGRVVVAAKGAKRPYSQLRAVLLPFARLNVSYGARRGAGEGASEVLPLKAAEWAGGPAPPGGAAVMTGFYLNELLMRLLARHDPHPALFDAYALTLPALGSGDELHVGAALRAFELLLLRETGLLPALDRVTLTQQPLAGAAHALRPETGLAPVAAGEPGLAAADWQALQAALDADDLAALQRACVAPQAELRALLRALLHYHLAAPMLRTRQVMIDLQNLQASTRSR